MESPVAMVFYNEQQKTTYILYFYLTAENLHGIFPMKVFRTFQPDNPADLTVPHLVAKFLKFQAPRQPAFITCCCSVFLSVAIRPHILQAGT